MFVALWEYEVKPGCEERFENAYGPGGEWVRLFRSDSNYKETRLLRDAFRPAIFLTFDFWNSREAYQKIYGSPPERIQEAGRCGGRANSQRKAGWLVRDG